MGHLLLGSATILAVLPDIVTVTADTFPRSAGGATCRGTHTNTGRLGVFTHRAGHWYIVLHKLLDKAHLWSQSYHEQNVCWVWDNIRLSMTACHYKPKCCCGWKTNHKPWSFYSNRAISPSLFWFKNCFVPSHPNFSKRSSYRQKTSFWIVTSYWTYIYNLMFFSILYYIIYLCFIPFLANSK